MFLKLGTIFLLLFTIFIYSNSLDKIPVHLNRDELGFSLNAYSIAQTGFDENGRFLPLYFWHLGVMWSTPIIVYTTALFLKVLPLSEATIRLPSLIVGMLNIVLIFFLAKKIFGSKKFGLLAAIFLALTPIHFIQSRILLDNLFPIPFIISWILLLELFLTKKNLWFLFFAVFLLGVGVHSYHATKVIMPLYVIFTILFVVFKLRNKELNPNLGYKKIIFIPLIAFTLPLLPLIPWLMQYPDTLTDQVAYTGLYDIKLTPLQGLMSLLTPAKIGQMISVYLKYFDPIFLFGKGDSSLIHSTGKVGVFLLPYVILLPVGIYKAFKNKTWFNLLLLVGFFTAPFAAALVSHEYRASKELFILPFATLLATLAIKSLLETYQKKWRILCWLLIMFSFLQFTYFLNDYFNGYRVRSYVWFDYDILGALEAVLAQEDTSFSKSVYLDSKIYYYTDRYWRFVLIKHKKESLFNKTFFYNPLSENPHLFVPNSIVLSRFDHTNNISIQTPTLNLVKNVLEPDDTSAFFVYIN